MFLYYSEINIKTHRAKPIKRGLIEIEAKYVKMGRSKSEESLWDFNVKAICEGAKILDKFAAACYLTLHEIRKFRARCGTILSYQYLFGVLWIPDIIK